ncbi:MAG: ribbon-helix-helix protein, CopG family [Rubrobacter sp.]|jgi:predicted DNA binding CopG/RHH family protein|nr:ribbon-helix-helix protein, CopG family [Rubrobacter sp.]
MSDAKGRTTSEKDERRRIEELVAEEQRVLERGDVQEMADFYDRTDTGDLPWEEAEDVVVGSELEQISIRLPKEDLDALRRRAAKSGVGYTTLIRMIVRAHLDNPLTY